MTIDLSRRRRTLQIVILTVCGSCVACSSNPVDVVCTTEVVPAIVVEIRDAVTGAYVAENVWGTVSEGTYSDSLQPYMSNSYGTLQSRQAAFERVGLYSISIQHNDYEPWLRSNIQVTANECHVNTVTLTAELVPYASSERPR